MSDFVVCRMFPHVVLPASRKYLALKISTGIFGIKFHLTSHWDTDLANITKRFKEDMKTGDKSV